MTIRDVYGFVEQGIQKIHVKYKDETIIFVSPSKGPGTYTGVMKALRKDKLLMPTTAQTILLFAYAMQNKDEPVCASIVSRFESKYTHLWTCTENLYEKGGVYLYDNPDGKLNVKDKAGLDSHPARFVKYGFKQENKSFSDFVENPYILAQVDGDPNIAQMIVEIAKSYNKNLNISTHSSASGKKHSALLSHLSSRELVVCGRRGGGNGCVFGVLE
jgi:hypothetical protein|tara:strand:- start:2303 stop:2950 length:648 start_codon:yes stop_codon:yes gene_type:complete